MNSKRIWDKLIAAGMTFAGAAALMGNLKAESNLEPCNLQNTYEHKLGHTDATYTAAVDDGSYNGFVADAAGYGLAQWTEPTRKAKLLAFAKAAAKSIGDLDMQIEFLIHEICTDFPVVWQVLTSTQDVRAASDVVLLRFERPSDTSERVRTLRAGFGEKFLAELGGEALPDPPTPPCPAQEAISVELTVGGKRYAGTLTEI